VAQCGGLPRNTRSPWGETHAQYRNSQFSKLSSSIAFHLHLQTESEDAVKSSEHAKKCVNSSECLDNGHSYCGLSIPFVGS